ncbi:Hypothetical protein SCLAV_3486 [Streptomyces clavuligerus]|uniref:Uncharacterized protein n=1 Tax=Streptomyces clavuligerus TaxID=1901 RepID=E2Q153_STRCL|nr:Hypothetical protein SCLAV_3486 [Streptomyces clavuligerus]
MAPSAASLSGVRPPARPPGRPVRRLTA